MVRVSNDLTELLLRQRFDNIVEKHDTFSSSPTLHSFFGDVNEVAISIISDAVENLISTKEYSKSTSKKAFAIAIEGLQNIYRHALKNENGESTGAFILLGSDSKWQFHFLNLIQNEGVEKMQKFCSEMMSFSLEETKRLYMKTLSTVDMTDKGGASLGCLLMKLKSDGNFEYNFESLEKEISCFHLFVTLSK